MAVIVAAIYLRISLDAAGLRAGVERQLEDCIRECRRRGWEWRVYEDNDRSAFSGKPRPAYEQMLTDVRNGEVQVIVAWAPDRLTRQLKELETLIATVEQAGCQVVTVQAGDWDLTTAEGRFMARQLGLLARLESEKISDRRSRMLLAQAKEGQPMLGGPRPWGFEDDRVTHRPAEAEAIRDAARRLLAGESMRSVAGLVEKDRLRLKRALLSPRTAGLRSHKGKLYPAVWDPILDRDTWDALQVVFAARKTGKRGVGFGLARKYLLPGWVTCGRCAARAEGWSGSAGVPQYRCPLGHVARGMRHVDDFVVGWLLENADFDAPQKGLDPQLAAAVNGYQARLEEVEAQMSEPGAPVAVLSRAYADLEAKLAEAKARLDEANVEKLPTPDQYPRTPGGVNPRTDPAGFRIAKRRMWWDDPVDGPNLDQKRAIIGQHIAEVRLLPVGKGKRFDPASVEIVPVAK